MASFDHLLQHTKPQFESPAKVFAKLKSKVQRGEVCSKEGRHGADFKSPRKRTQGTWMTDALNKNERFGYNHNQAHALTLSPISSPRKTFGYSCSGISSRDVGGISNVTDMGHGFSPRKGAFLESTAVSHPPPLINRKQIYTEPRPIRDSAGFSVTARTPVKQHPQEYDSVFEAERAPQTTPAKMFSPTRKRLKMKSEGTKGFCGEVMRQPRTRAFTEDGTRKNTNVERREISETNQITHGPVPMKRCYVVIDRIPPLTPAKMFAYMKMRESEAERQEAQKVSSSTGIPFDGDHAQQSRRTTPFTADYRGEMNDDGLSFVPESAAPVHQSRIESADSQSDTDPPEDAGIPTAPSHPILVEDPLVLHTPRISIPKKNRAVFKHNKWPQLIKFPYEDVIYLKQWYLRMSPKGLFVDGIHQDENIPWHSTIIVERVSDNVVKTVSGRVYVLVGKMKLTGDSEFPTWLLKKFINGFPPNWKELYEKFLSDPKDSSRETEGKRGARSRVARTKSEASSVDRSVKHQGPNPRMRTESAKVSRSGRVIKPPLEYWKGGRVLLDADMNVTIHECYNTSVCIPDVTTTVSARNSKKPARVFLPSSEGHKGCDSASNEETSVPLRRAKAPLRKQSRAKLNPEPPMETRSSSGEFSERRERSSRRCATSKNVPEGRSDPEKSSTRSKNPAHDTVTSARISQRKAAALASSHDETSQDQSSEDEIYTRRKPRGKRVARARQKKSQLSSTSSSDSSKESEREFRKRNRVTKSRDAAQTKDEQSKFIKPSQQENHSPKLAQSRNKPKANKGNTLHKAHEEDEDRWTEAELMRLQEAVSLYPKHTTGYWAMVARVVGTRSAEECHNQHTSQRPFKTPAKKPQKKKVEAPINQASDHPVISARVGTLKRKQQLRDFLATMPKEDMEDGFSSAYMKNKRFEMPTMIPTEGNDFRLSELEPLTPKSSHFPKIKTPQCLHITPGMMGSPNRASNDKYVFQLQNKMKKRQFNVCKQAPSKALGIKDTPSIKRTMRRCGNTENDTFVVWEMFPGNDGALSDSGEEEDFYFSDND